MPPPAEAFPPEALAEAEAAAAKPVGDPIGVPFVTIDPPGSRDLDQALHIERTRDGHRLRYAIADLAFFVDPGGALDRALWERGVTYYLPDRSIPLHPPVLSEGAASLLPDQATPAVLWTLELDARGLAQQIDVRRAVVRSTAQYDYAHVPDELLGLLQEVGERREARERERGGVSLPTPEQEVDADGTLHYRAPLPSENWNAQLSLLTGMAAADLMLEGGTGLLRTLPPAEPRALDRLRRVAAALGHEWGNDQDYGDFIRTLDPFDARDAAILRAATGVLRGAGYIAFDGPAPAYARHAALAEEYAHVTAPLRRLADRYATECALAACAGTPVPAWVREQLADLPAVMAAADHEEAALERAAVDRAEATALSARVGETFDAVAIDAEHVQLRDPAVRAPCDGDPPLGKDVRVKLVTADPASGTVRFVSVGAR
jgi:exoribonuclease R